MTDEHRDSLSIWQGMTDEQRGRVVADCCDCTPGPCKHDGPARKVERIKAAAARYRECPVDSSDRPESWRLLEALLTLIEAS